MKKICFLIIALILLITITGLAYGKTEEIVVMDALASANTAAANPAAYLVDGDTRTQWITEGNTPGSAWVDIKLTEPALIEGLKLYGPFSGDFAVEYWQDGWRQFFAARFLKGSEFSSGWNIIDLSFDRIVTGRLRLVFTNPEQHLRLGGVGEVKVLGCKAGDIFERLDPVSVTTNRRAESGYPAEYLFDHNTYTSWRLNPGEPLTAEMVADLGGICAVKRIKLFGANEGKDKLKEHTIFTVQYLRNNNWCDIPGMMNLDMLRIGAAWQRFDLDRLNIVTDKIRVLMNGGQGSGSLKEVEIWGNHQALSGSKYLFAGGTPAQLTGEHPANYNITIKKPLKGILNLHLAGIGNPAAALTWELNGKTMGRLIPASTSHGFVIYSQPLAAEDLWDGVNFIRIYGSNLTLYDCRLEIAPANRFILSNTGGLTDRWLLTSAGDGEEIIDFGVLRDIDELILKSLRIMPGVQIAIDREGQWVNCNSPYRTVNDASGSEIIYSGIGPARRVKVSFSPGLDGLTEISLNSSPVNDGAPCVRILAPLDGDFLSLAEWTKLNLRGTVDNPEATLKINGHPVNLNGISFEIPLTELGLKEEEAEIITAVATDLQGRTGSDRITITVGKPPEFTVNLPEQITYTKESQITVSGKVAAPASKVMINGNEVPVINLAFSTTVDLREGFNEIIIKVSVNDKFKNVNTKARYVVRNSTPPYLKVLNPANGQIVGEKEITISGETSSLNPVNITVNGQAATVNSGSFTSAAISLMEGENKIVVLAVDQAGLTSRVELTVYRDSVKPELLNIYPPDNANLNTPAIAVTGAVLDASPVSVLVNGKAATITNKLFNAALDLAEGWNDLTIIARDAAGNTKTELRKVFIDTRPPAAFVPTADPSGWTNNNRPVISFVTTDAESGIGHYEISVAGGSWISDISSPYWLPQAVPDGEQLIRVKAVDKAGNETIGEVKVYIDTVPPAAPEGFEAISGIGKVTLKWQDPLGEIIGFRLIRTPSFPGTAYRELLRTNETVDKIDSFCDEDVTPGASYTYTLKAIDHAVNYSAATEPAMVKVGVAVQEVSELESATVKFDKCEVTLPEKTFAEPVKVVVQETKEELPENTYAEPVSPAYSFSIQNDSGVEIKPEFAKPVALTISYADMQIPAGFSAGDLGIYWYNRESGDWEKLEHVANDFENKTLAVPLAHFSEYQVMASNYISPSLDSYYNLGVSPFGSYFQDNVESVSPTSGSLSISAVDFKLPGRNGMDLIIKRIYDSAVAQQEKIIAINGESSHKAPIDTFSYGWSLNIPWIEGSDKGKFVRLPDGQTIKIDFEDDVFIYHEGIHFTLRQSCERYLFGIICNVTSYMLTLKDGTVYEFDEKGKVTKQTDPSGKNFITYNYSGRQLTHIYDSINRDIKFNYKPVGSRNLISEIEIVGAQTSRIVQYKYDDKGNLWHVYDPLNRETTFNYQGFPLTTGYSCNIYRHKCIHVTGVGTTDSYDRPLVEDKVKNFNLDLISGVTYPTKSSSSYTYDVKTQGASESWNDESNTTTTTFSSDGKTSMTYFNHSIDRGTISVTGQKVLVITQKVMNKVTNYNYELNAKVGSLRNSTFTPDNSYIFKCEIQEGKKSTIEYYKQLTKEEQYELKDFSARFSAADATGYLGSLLGKREIVNDTIGFETVEFKYSNLKLRVPSSEEHYRNNSLIYTISNEYDSWGNLTYRVDGSRDFEESWTYHFPAGSAIKNLVETNIKYNKNSVTGTVSTVTTSYQYNDSIGKPSQITVEGGDEPQITKLEYDDYSNLNKRTEANGLITTITYDNGAFPNTKTITGVKDADSKSVGDIITRYHYNNESGMKEWEEDPRGNRTTYEYDALNRITKAILPDDDTTSSNNPFRSYEFQDTPDANDVNGYNYCIFRDENGKKTRFNFDGLGRLVEVIKNEDKSTADQQVKTSYQYDVQGRIDKVTDPRLYDTTYEYDALNRVTKVIYPTFKDRNNNDVVSFVTLDYQDLTNTVVITEKNGIIDSVVTEKSDWANRLTEAVQNCSYDGVFEHDYFWYFGYDSLGNKIRQVDPLTRETNQVFDPLGHLTEIDLPAAMLADPETYQTGLVNPKVTYEYDIMGNRTGEMSANGNVVTPNNDNYKTEYTYDELGRVISVERKSSDETDTVVAITKNYYDAAGNKVRTVTFDEKNTAKLYQDKEYTYSARGFLLSEDLVLERSTNGVAVTKQNLGRYRYDPMGNKIAAIDPRNPTDAPIIWYSFNGDQLTLSDLRSNKSFTTWYIYDDLNRLYRTILPDTTAPGNPYADGVTPSNPYTETTYDKVGNKVTERDVNGLITKYTYYPRNWVKTVEQGSATSSLKLKATYYYDARGNQTEVVDALNNVTKNKYDSLGRLRKVIHPLTNVSEELEYDALGNRIAVKDGNTHRTQYSYNALGWLTGVMDPLGGYTEYQYDPDGNQVKQISAGNLTTTNYYDEQNRVVEQKDSLGYSTTYEYDVVGNRVQMVDRRLSTWVYQYYPDNLLKRVDVSGLGETPYSVEYQYDAAGNRKNVIDNGGKSIEYDVDELNRTNSITRGINNKGYTYTTEYHYNSAKSGLLDGITYPDSASILEYTYNDLNQLNEVVGFTKQQGITYYDDGAVRGISYINNFVATYTYDNNRRLDTLKVQATAGELYNLDYQYDGANNITWINDREYRYDSRNQLIYAKTPGKFMETDYTTGDAGCTVGDYLGDSWLDFTVGQGNIRLDYDASSIGIDFGIVAPKIKKILLVPQKGQESHRLTYESLELYTSNDNSVYTVVPRDNWEYARDTNGVITINLKETIGTRYLKLHVKFDNRNNKYSKVDKSSFLNDLAKMLQVYQEATSRIEEYGYDNEGNRDSFKLQLVRTAVYDSEYYTNSNRLKKDGKYAYAYDRAGNLTEKGNKYTFGNTGEQPVFTTSGEGVEYWHYTYDLLNRLIEVKKGDKIVSGYEYDPEGLRVVKKAYDESGTLKDTTHYVFEGTEPIFEKSIETGKVKSYVYAFGKHLARVDGVIGDPNAKKYFYHTDQVGSVRAVTDVSGAKVWDADYYAFGTQYGKSITDSSFDEWHGFNGKEFDHDTGLYYYNTRWYDSDIGRFISEDPIGDPNNPNLYSYCRNNPLNLIDPTGTEAYSQEMENYYQQLSKPFADQVTVTNSNGTTTSYNKLQMKLDFNILADLQKAGLDDANDYEDQIKEKYKDFLNSFTEGKEGVTQIGLRGFGFGNQYHPTELPYDDMMIVVSENGIEVFNEFNFEGSTSENDTDNKGINPVIANGDFTFKTGKHKGEFDALVINDNKKVDTKGSNPNAPIYDEKGNVIGYETFMTSVHIHTGGGTWNSSHGCLTLYSGTGVGAEKYKHPEWVRYMNNFPEGTSGNLYIREW